MRTRLGTQRTAIGLYRVSTAEQGQSGLGQEAQPASRAGVYHGPRMDAGGRVLGHCQRQGRSPAWLPGLAHPLPSARGDAGGSTAGPDHPTRPHAVAPARRRLLGPTGQHGRRRRPHDAGPRRHGPERARAEPQTYTGGADSGQSARGSDRKCRPTAPPCTAAAASTSRPNERTKQRQSNRHRAACSNFWLSFT